MGSDRSKSEGLEFFFSNAGLYTGLLNMVRTVLQFERFPASLSSGNLLRNASASAE